MCSVSWLRHRVKGTYMWSARRAVCGVLLREPSGESR